MININTVLKEYPELNKKVKNIIIKRSRGESIEAMKGSGLNEFVDLFIIYLSTASLKKERPYYENSSSRK